MTTQAKIIAFYNLLLLLGSFTLLLILLPFILSTLTSTILIILLIVLVLIPMIWGTINSIKYLLGKPVSIKSLKRWEQMLAMVPLINVLLILGFITFALVSG